jgi:hypothetical protein
VLGYWEDESGKKICRPRPEPMTKSDTFFTAEFSHFLIPNFLH